jgi:hypothetical protein
MAQKYPPASQFGPPVWGNKKLRERIKSSDIIQKLLKIESDSIISREDLCEKIDVDPAPFKSSNPEQRASFTYWFHQYLRVLRSMIDDYVKKEGIDGIMLLYPDIYSGDMDGEEPTETGGGPGIGLLLLRGARAIAAVLELRNRGVQAAIKRSIRTTYQLLTDKSGYMTELSKKERHLLMQNMRWEIEGLKNANLNSEMIIANLLADLPEVEGFKRRDSNVDKYELTNDEFKSAVEKADAKAEGRLLLE